MTKCKLDFESLLLLLCVFFLLLLVCCLFFFFLRVHHNEEAAIPIKVLYYYSLETVCCHSESNSLHFGKTITSLCSVSVQVFQALTELVFSW